MSVKQWPGVSFLLLVLSSLRGKELGGRGGITPGTEYFKADEKNDFIIEKIAAPLV